MEKSFWNHLGLLLASVIGVLFLLVIIGVMLFFFNYPEPLACLFGTLGYVIILSDNVPEVIRHVKKYLAYRKLN